MSESTAAILPIKSDTQRHIDVESIQGQAIDLDDGTLPELPPVPDGGYGWVVVLAAFISNFITFGYILAWGVLQEHYYNIVFDKTYPLSTITFVGSVYMVLMLLAGLFLRIPLSYLGLRGVMWLGTALFALGLVLASFATQLWHLFLTLTLLPGLGAGMLFYPAVSLISQYFNRRRALAMGIALSGSGVGGLVLAPIYRALLDSVGLAWTLRILAIIFFVLCCIAVLSCRERIPVKKLLAKQQELRIAREATMPESKRPGILMTLANKVVNLGVLRRKDVRIVAIIGFVCVFAFLVPFYFLPTYALFIGLSRSQAAAVTGIMSGINAVGRVVFGQLAIPFGSINMLFVSSAITCLSLCLIWPFSTTFGSLLVFAIIHGFASGGFITLLTVVAAECSTLEDMSDTLGLTYSMAIFGQLFGPSIFASILNSTGGTSYLPSQLYCAAMYAVGLIFMVWLRLTKSKQLCSRV